MNNIVIFKSGDQPVQVRLEGETVWLTQAQMAELFGTSTDNISLHLKNVYADNELDEPATTEDFSVVRQEGARQVKRQLKHYNLDAIISVGYRVSSARATQFRIWATNTLRQHLVEGYTLNQQRLKERDRRQQAHRLLPVPMVSAPESALAGATGGAADQRQHPGGAGAAGGREQARSEGIDGETGGEFRVTERKQRIKEQRWHF